MTDAAPQSAAETAGPSVVDPAADPFDPACLGGEIVLFDLEFTAWEGSLARGWSEPWEHREIIQFGAVRVRDNDSMGETGRFLCYVSPERNPQLSAYITDLTGIDQATLDNEGFDFPEAWDVFQEFCDGARAVLSYSGDPDVLAENCRLHGLKQPDWRRFGDLDACLGRRAGPEFAQSTSYDLPTLVGLKTIGRAHDAMDDSLAIAETLRVLRRRGVI
ncbi:MAG: exonuclease domain-containing protein [Alphaproteobacteria bacterium]|nr:exonuclease domain-containing protein [Alphaproteobacteria bacterium]MBO6862936.1 exonuclease domain-containing protein [Alphaproteobacteria bacterium]